MLVRDDGRDDLTIQKPRVVWRARRQRQRHVQAVRARSLGQPDSSENDELVMNPACDVQHTRKRHTLGWIEIERCKIGVLRMRDTREPGILRDGGELRRVKKRLQ